jgi:hypothetical protein
VNAALVIAADSTTRRSTPISAGADFRKGKVRAVA